MSAPPVFTAKTLNLPGVSHGFFGRRGGVSSGLYGSLNAGRGSGDEAVLVQRNRARIARAMGLAADRLAGVYQVHSARAVALDAPWPDAPPKADALVTRAPGLGLSILTADCAPVLLADAGAGVIGAAHAGWRGALDGILEATLLAMEELGANRGDLHAVIGPCISQPSYEVGPEFAERFMAQDEAAGRFFTAGEGDRQHFDLPGYCARRLHKAGAGQVHSMGLDTCAMKRDFFSYRRACQRGEPDYGRNISVISLPESDMNH